MKADIEEKLKGCEILKEIKIYQTKQSEMFIQETLDSWSSIVINYFFFPGKNIYCFWNTVFNTPK